MKPGQSNSALILVGKIMLVCGLLLVLPAPAPATTTSTAESVAACVGYAVSGQQEHRAALDNVQCTLDIAQGQGGVEKGFFFFSSVITHQKNLEGTTVIEGMFIHKDRLQRKIFSLFTIEYSGIEPAVVRSVRVRPAKAAKPHIEMFYMPSSDLSADLVTKLSHPGALELALDKAVSPDEEAGPSARGFLALAFQMNRERAGSRLEIVLSDSPGVAGSQKTGTSVAGDGWVYAALNADFSLNAGPERFFNVVQQLPSGERRVVAVYSSHSLARQVRQELRDKGYDPGPGGERTGQAVKAFQEQVGLHPDGEGNASLLRVLKASGVKSAVALVQQGLNTLGYDAGPVDGMFGARSKKALQAFQGDAGLPRDGVLTASLLCHITDALAFQDFFAAAADGIESTASTVTAKKTPVSTYPDRMWPNQVEF